MRPLKMTATLWVAMALAAAGTGATAQATDKPVRGGTLVIANHYGEPNTYDCHAASGPNVMTRLAPHYSLLLQIDGDNYPQVKGDLARSWKVSPDGLVYEFKLHTGVKFHDGTPLTAQDVQASYERIRNPPPDVVSVRKAMYQDITSIEAPDAGTVIFRLSKPNAAMLQLLAVPFSCVYSARLMAQDPSYPAKRVMGSGPFRFVRYVAGQEWVGERHEQYFKAPMPYTDGFRIVSVSRAADMTALASGQAMFGLRGMTADELARVISVRGDKSRIVGQDKATAVAFMVAINTQRPPLDDVRVRKALLLASDRWGASAALRNSYAMTRVGAYQRPTSSFARTDKELERLPGFGRDIEASRREARRLLAEAGHPALKLRFVNNRSYAWVGVVLTDHLRQIGVTVEHVTLDTPQVVARRAAGDYELLMDTLPEYLDDPTVQMAVFQPFKTNPANSSRSEDETADRLYESQKAEMDPGRRKEKVQALEEYLLGKAYYLPMFWNSDFARPISADVGGLGSMSSNYSKLDLADLWLRSAGR